jgi:hypothetical protein
MALAERFTEGVSHLVGQCCEGHRDPQRRERCGVQIFEGISEIFCYPRLAAADCWAHLTLKTLKLAY